MENNKFFLIGELIRKKDFGKVVRGTIKVYSDGYSEYIPFVSFGQTAYHIKSIIDGANVTAKCRIHTSSFERDGKKVYSTDIVVDSITCNDID